MNKLKKQLILLAVISMAPLLLIGSIIAIIDPFFVYHKPIKGAYYVIDNQLEQNPGIAKHFEYDSVMLGSSMTTNFDTNRFNELLDVQMVKLSYNAAYPKDIDNIMKIVTEEKEDLSHAFLCIDIANYMHTPGIVSYTYPEHLYDKNPLNDLKYLLNKDVFLTYILGSFVTKENTPINEIYWHWQYMDYSKAHVLSNYSTPQAVSEASGRYSLANLETNLKQYILPYIEATPDTQWHILFPPYSMLYWNDSLAAKEADIKIDGMAYITERMLTYDNVEVHYFQDASEWIGNLDNYTDVTHFSKAVTDEMTVQLCEDTQKVTIDTYEERLEAFRAYVESYDYKALLEKDN